MAGSFHLRAYLPRNRLAIDQAVPCKVKRLLFLLTLVLAPSLHAAHTEFAAQTTGSNLNAGSTTADAALVTGTGGNWNAGTGVYTFAGPTDLSDVSAGMWASVYNDGATIA